MEPDRPEKPQFPTKAPPPQHPPSTIRDDARPNAQTLPHGGLGDFRPDGNLIGPNHPGFGVPPPHGIRYDPICPLPVGPEPDPDDVPRLGPSGVPVPFEPRGMPRPPFDPTRGFGNPGGGGFNFPGSGGGGGGGFPRF